MLLLRMDGWMDEACFGAYAEISAGQRTGCIDGGMGPRHIEDEVDGLLEGKLLCF